MDQYCIWNHPHFAHSIYPKADCPLDDFARRLSPCCPRNCYLYSSEWIHFVENYWRNWTFTIGILAAHNCLLFRLQKGNICLWKAHSNCFFNCKIELASSYFYSSVVDLAMWTYCFDSLLAFERMVIRRFDICS